MTDTAAWAAGRPDAAPAPSDVLDQHILADLRALGREPGKLLVDMLSAFLVDAPKLVAEIEAMVGANAFEAAAGTAHHLKGLSGQCGAARVARACDGIQLGTGPMDPDSARHAVALIRHETELALDAARQTLGAIHPRLRRHQDRPGPHGS